MTDDVFARKVHFHIARYRDLLTAFTDGDIGADEFVPRYLSAYLNERDTRLPSPEVFGVIDGFFADVDSYVDDDSIRDPEEGDLDESELRERARRLLAIARVVRGGVDPSRWGP